MKRNNEDWSAREREADAERGARHRRGPGLRAKVHARIVTDDVLGIMWLGGKLKSICKRRVRMAAAGFCALCAAGCATAKAPPPNPAVEAAKAQVYGAVYEMVAGEIKLANP